MVRQPLDCNAALYSLVDSATLTLLLNNSKPPSVQIATFEPREHCADCGGPQRTRVTVTTGSIYAAGRTDKKSSRLSVGRKSGLVTGTEGRA
jgi:hypothetical protein